MQLTALRAAADAEGVRQVEMWWKAPTAVFPVLPIMGLVLGLSFGHGAAVSTVTDVIPENIADQPIHIRVESSPSYKGLVYFRISRISVTAGKHEVSPSRLGLASEPEPCSFMEMYAGKPPVSDADPDIRHEETIRVPTRLVFPRSHPRWPAVSYDTTCVQTVVLNVGHKMTLGVGSRLSYDDGAEVIELGRGLRSIGCLSCGGRVLNGVTEVMDRQGSLQIIEELVLFETDIPDQHLWQPKRGRYQELWRGVATGVLERER
ncbi:MAG: hypothetical protein ACE5G2_03310 [Candidatus Krumholzibacteriia bacterium]